MRQNSKESSISVHEVEVELGKDAATLCKHLITAFTLGRGRFSDKVSEFLADQIESGTVHFDLGSGNFYYVDPEEKKHIFRPGDPLYEKIVKAMTARHKDMPLNLATVAVKLRLLFGGRFVMTEGLEVVASNVLESLTSREANRTGKS